MKGIKLLISLIISLSVYQSNAQTSIFQANNFNISLRDQENFDNDSLDRNFTFDINFESPFLELPKMAVSIIGINSTGTQQAFFLEVINITDAQFTLNLIVLQGNIVYEVWISYLATTWGIYLP